MNDLKPETLEALKDSIAHWERLANGERHEGEEIFGDDCALCALFNSSENQLNCAGCPVAAATGLTHCMGGPWKDVYATFQSIAPPLHEDEDDCSEAYNSPEFKEAAAEMVAFLKSLLPKPPEPTPQPGPDPDMGQPDPTT